MDDGKKEKAKKASRGRTKKTGLVIVDAVATEFAGTVPFGEVAYTGVKQLVTHTIEFLRDRERIRVEDFIEGLCRGVPEDKRDAFLHRFSAETSAEDFAAVAKHVVDDEEDAKIPVYSVLLRGLVHIQTESAYRRHLLKAARALTVADLRKLTVIRAKQSDLKRQFRGKPMD